MNSNTSATPALATDQPLTSAELGQAHLYLRQTRAGLHGATKRLSETQWNFKPAPERWSIAEIVEHVMVVQERVLGPISDQLTSAPPPPAGYDYNRVDALVIHNFPDRLVKFPSPIPATLSGETPAEALHRFDRNCNLLAESLAAPGLRNHAIDSAPLKGISKGEYGLMDGYQWILAAAAHTERHTKQILEVVADASFPER
jgi:hypothetical protein